MYLLPCAHGARLHRGEVRARARLAVALAPPDVAAHDAGQEALLLLGRAEGHDHRRHHHRAEGHDARRAGERAFLLEQVALRRVPARAAELLRPGEAVPALLAEDARPGLHVVAVSRSALCTLWLIVLGQVLGDPGADLGAEREFVGGEVQVHRQRSFVSAGNGRSDCDARCRLADRQPRFSTTVPFYLVPAVTRLSATHRSRGAQLRRGSAGSATLQDSRARAASPRVTGQREEGVAAGEGGANAFGRRVVRRHQHHGRHRRRPAASRRCLMRWHRCSPSKPVASCTSTSMNAAASGVRSSTLIAAAMRADALDAEAEHLEQQRRAATGSGDASSSSTSCGALAASAAACARRARRDALFAAAFALRRSTALGPVACRAARAAASGVAGAAARRTARAAPSGFSSVKRDRHRIRSPARQASCRRCRRGSRAARRGMPASSGSTISGRVRREAPVALRGHPVERAQDALGVDRTLQVHARARRRPVADEQRVAHALARAIELPATTAWLASATMKSASATGSTCR